MNLFFSPYLSVPRSVNVVRRREVLIFFFCSMLMLQSRQDVEKAAELVNEALMIDEKCDFAYETLATLEVQR